jgi:pteridine reductase
MEPSELRDKVILVTGGAIRLGKAMALHAARLGMHVAITYRSSAQPAEETRAEIEALGRQCFAIRCDQSNADEIQPAVDAILAHFGKIDVLVNSASNFEVRDFFDITPEGWDNVLNTNARGPFFFSQIVARHMLARSEAEGLQGQVGSIVNIIDESVHRPTLQHPDHGVSKNALWAVTRLSALRLGPKIRVNAIMPGAVLKPPDYSDEHWAAIGQKSPLKKVGGPQDICRALEFLMLSDFVTGQMIVVEGGTTI